MSVIYRIPKTSKFIQTTSTFIALFNNPTLGKYDFNRANNTRVAVLPVNTNSLYLIEKINIAATIPEEEYLFNISVVPLVSLRFAVENQRVFPFPLPVVQYVKNMECVAWAWSDKGGDALQMELKIGILNQDLFLVGVPSVSVNVSLNIYEITDNGFIQDFKNDNFNTSIGKNTNLRSSNSVVV